VIELGQRRFDSYATGSNEMVEKPWKLEIKSQAVLLVEKVRRMPQRNEVTWRSACEPLIFARMEAEVAWYNLAPPLITDTLSPANTMIK
jgi:hypothetical protein